MSMTENIIGDEDDLYLRIKSDWIVSGGKVDQEAFKPRPKECGKKSVDWSGLSTPEATIARDTSKFKKFNRCARLQAGAVRKKARLKVEHRPTKTNPAHSNYFNPVKLRRGIPGCDKLDSFELLTEFQLDALHSIARTI